MRKKQTYHFYLQPAYLPTHHNLSYYLIQQNWKSTCLSWRAQFSNQHFQFYLPATSNLEFKHSLARLVQKYCAHVMPVTYSINDNNWFDIVQELTQKQSDAVWILKPSLQNNGQNIHVFQTIDLIKSHYLSPNRLGGEHVLQHYLRAPHLLQGPEKGHKYSIRLFVVLTNYAGVYLYPQGYFNVALTPYEPSDFKDLRSHLTNEHLKEQVLNVAQIPSQQYAHLFDRLYPTLKEMISSVMQGLQKEHPEGFMCKKQRTLAIVGFDFMVDSAMRVWLLEANHGPCFPVNQDHPLQKKLYEGFWKALIACFVYPIASHQAVEQIQTPSFEKVL